MNVKVKLEGKTKPKGLTFQELILKLMHFWDAQDCVLQQPYDTEVGAGTMHPETFLRVLGKEPYSVAFVQPSRRPADGRAGAGGLSADRAAAAAAVRTSAAWIRAASAPLNRLASATSSPLPK